MHSSQNLKTTLKFVWKHKNLQKVKTILNKKYKSGDIILEFKVYYKVIIIKISREGEGNRDRNVGQGKRTMTYK